MCVIIFSSLAFIQSNVGNKSSSRRKNLNGNRGTRWQLRGNGTKLDNKAKEPLKFLTHISPPKIHWILMCMQGVGSWLAVQGDPSCWLSMPSPSCPSTDSMGDKRLLWPHRQREMFQPENIYRKTDLTTQISHHGPLIMSPFRC